MFTALNMNPVRSDGYRRIVHIDMDCFYAAVEIRDRPELASLPVAVGGTSRRGVLSTCNYVAREFGVRSAMPAFKALDLCPHLVILPVDFKKYRAVSHQIRAIFSRYTDLIEPLSLDEAYLDLTHLDEPASLTARKIRESIHKETALTASAGIGPNMLLAKIASDWRKPNNQFTINPERVEAFMRTLPLRKLRGIGPRSAERLKQRGYVSCADLQQLSKDTLGRMLGKYGTHLYSLCRGIDDRPVTPYHQRKSISRERTFSQDLEDPAAILEVLEEIYPVLAADIDKQEAKAHVHKSFIKLTFDNFTRTSVEESAKHTSLSIYQNLARKAWERQKRPVRLVGIGVRLADANHLSHQLELSLTP